MRIRLVLVGLMMVAGASALGMSAATTTAAADPQTLEYSTSNPAEFTTVQYARRVCCKRGRHDWWTSARQCRRVGGYRVSARHCRNDWREVRDVRVCCKRGRYDWWTTRRACARAGGYRVAAWQCRNG
jgi:hypothetical protein